MDQLTIILIATAAFVISGAVKGVAGIGLPTAAIALMTLFLPPRTAIALVLFPMLGSNLWQMVRGGHLRRTMRRYCVFAVVLFLGVCATAFSTQNVTDRILLAILGIVVLLFVWISWKGVLPQIPERHDGSAQVGFALLAGVIGGMTAAWGPPLAMYLATKRVEKEEFIRATGFLISVGSLPLALAYAQIGFLNGPLASVSAAMILPALIGFSIGEAFRRRMSVEAFRNAILVVFVVLGLNMVRRAIWYQPI